MRGFSKDQISDRMRLIRSKHTKPERAVRSIASKLGLNYRVHEAQLPGTPDLVFSGRRKVVLVHGCFWHQHRDCRLQSIPRTNPQYWLPKFQRIKARDRRNKAALTRLGWEYLVVWECETSDPIAVARRVARFIGGKK
jgi:DNA mismatch endonuclease (patch repair protein)